MGVPNGRFKAIFGVKVAAVATMQRTFALLVGVALSTGAWVACSGAERDEPGGIVSRDPETAAPAGDGAGPGMGRGPGMGMGPGGRPGAPGEHPSLACTFGQGPLPDVTLAGVREALLDEWRAEATYEAFSKKFGQPFPRLERAEGRHADLLTKLLAAHAHEAPSRPEAKLAEATSITDACSVSLQAEKANVAMYDKLLAAKPADDVRCVYEHLRMLSADRHIPALERCGGRRP